MDERPLSILQVLEKGSFTTGSVVQMFELARALARRGHPVGVVSRPEGEVGKRCAGERIPFFPLPLRHEFDLASARGLARLVEERDVDVVHVHKGIAHSAALFATFFSRRRPVLVVNRGVSFPLDPFAALKFRIRLDAVVTVCEDIKRIVVATGGVAPEKVHVVYAGVDLSRFDPGRADGARVRREWNVADDEQLVLQVGARDWKGWRDLVSASALLAPDFRRLTTAIVACKDEAEKERVLAFAREKGIGDRVLAIGFRTDMPDVLAAADVVADLSYEGLGITGTIREAMALGRPVVASAAGGNPELVQHEVSGLLVPPRDPVATAAALSRVLSGPDHADRLGRAARERVTERFSTDVRLDRIEALYRDLVAISGRSRRGTRRAATIRDR
ncbi:MAG TPA: glycosyltransferase family 4 protein [Thermoanaerobaculia bacterium]|nr:glycosyltransferase family 4 protein [Thermoanaerobaculia bacterium]